MFSIMENIYDGWQYLINILSLVGGNFHLVIENIGKMSDYVTNLFDNFPLPAWVSSVAFAVLGFGIVAKICHWGC